MTEFLAGVVGAVEANSFEHLMLWDRNTQRGGAAREWKSKSSGLMEVVGELAEMPVCISLLTAEVDGHKLLFFHATSQVVDHRMVDEWLERTLPPSAFRENGRVNRTDAMNFHNVFRTRATPVSDGALGRQGKAADAATRALASEGIDP